jgi:hypothetical protein
MTATILPAYGRKATKTAVPARSAAGKKIPPWQTVWAAILGRVAGGPDKSRLLVWGSEHRAEMGDEPAVPQPIPRAPGPPPLSSFQKKQRFL